MEFLDGCGPTHAYGCSNNDRWCNCDGDCNGDNVYGNDGGGGTMATKAKENGKRRSPMRQLADGITNEIIKALVESIDEGGALPGVAPDHDGIRQERVW